MCFNSFITVSHACLTKFIDLQGLQQYDVAHYKSWVIYHEQFDPLTLNTCARRTASWHKRNVELKALGQNLDDKLFDQKDVNSNLRECINPRIVLMSIHVGRRGGRLTKQQEWQKRNRRTETEPEHLGTKQLFLNKHQ